MLNNQDTIKLISSKEIFKKNLRSKMLERNMRSADVCRALNIDKNTFSGWYTGKCLPSPLMLEKLCKYFGTTPQEFLNGTSEEPKADINDHMQQLEKLIGYFKDGLITAEEYNTLKKKLMESL